MNKNKFKSNPYNSSNKLIQLNEIINIMSQLNINNFKVNNIKLYQKAFIHKSYCKIKDSDEYKNEINALPLFEESYEKMEFLGDSLLGITICEYIYKRYSVIYNQDEGFLTNMKNRLVNGETLAKLATLLNFNKYLIISKHIEDNCNGRNNVNILEDTLEAFICAIYLDTNDINLLKNIIINLYEKYIDFSYIITNNTNYKDQILRYFHNNFKLYPKYETIEKDNIFESKLYKEDELISIGTGDTKKKAEQNSSKNALIKYNVLN
jgi:ribonuclease-3